MRITRYERKAFTLIEMLLVVIIIGVLASGLVLSLAGRSEESRVARAKSDISGSLSVALDLYEQNMGRYPSTDEGLKVLVQTNGDARWKGPYIRNAMKPDPWGHDYIYEFNAETGGYNLRSAGPDGRPNTEDDITE
jgi:general secretion pathway protein G